jgi:type IV pilus assembly protein PilW
VQSTLGLNAGDLMLAVPSSQSGTEWCTLFTVKANGANTLTSTQVPHATAGASWNPSATIMPTTYLSGATLAKANDLVYRTFVVASGNLQTLDLQASDDTIVTTTVGNNIVLLKAFYGKDTTGDGTVDAYDTTTPTTTAGWQQIRTIRLAVVARSAQREKDAVTTSNPTLNVGSTVSVSGSAVCGSTKCITLQVSPITGSDTEWQHYRYKVFDTVVPLRNILWSS